MHAGSRWLVVGACSVLVGAACDGLIGLEQPSIAPHDAGGAHDAATRPDASSGDAGTDAVVAVDASDATREDAPNGPVALVSGANLGPLATDATYVYWLDSTHGQVMRCPIAGCPSGPTVFYSQPGYDQGSGWGIGGIAAQSDSIYFAMNQTADGMLIQCPSSDCGSPIYIVKGTTGSGGIFGVTADSSHVYFAMGAGLFECPLQGGCSIPSPSTSLVASGVSAHMGGIAVASGRVYFAANAANPVGECSATGCGGVPVLINLSGSPAVGIAANATAVYWTDETGSQVLESLWPANSWDGVFVLSPATQQIVADDNAVYFGSKQSGGAIYSCPVTGCGNAPTLVAGNLGNVGALAIDPYLVYAGVYSTGQPGEIIEIKR